MLGRNEDNAYYVQEYVFTNQHSRLLVVAVAGGPPTAHGRRKVLQSQSAQHRSHHRPPIPSP